MNIEVGNVLVIDGEKYRVYSITEHEINLHNEKGILKTIVVNQ